MLKPNIPTLAALVLSTAIAATPIAFAQQGGKPARTPDKGMMEMMTEMKRMVANCNQTMERMNQMMESMMKNMPMAPSAPAAPPAR
jgi:hypothetical protein